MTIAATSTRVISINQMVSITEALRKNPTMLGLDLETTGLNPRKNKIVALMFGTQQHVYILDARPFYSVSKEEQAYWSQVVRDFISAAPVFVGHNLKFDWSFLYHAFGAEAQQVVDTLLQEQVIYGVGLGGGDEDDDDTDSGGRIELGLESVGVRYGYAVQKGERAWFYKPAPLDERVDEWNAPFPEEQVAYMTQDIVVPLGVSLKQHRELVNRGLLQVANLENAALPAFALMECAGCLVDKDKWRAVIAAKEVLRTELALPIIERLTPAHEAVCAAVECYTNSLLEGYTESLKRWEQDKLAVRVRAEAAYAQQYSNGAAVATLKKTVSTSVDAWVKNNPRPKKPTMRGISPINIASPSQVGEALAYMGYKNIVWDKKTKCSKPSTSKSVLERLLPDDLISDFMAWRKLDKFITAFGEKILEKAEADGRIHPEYSQIGAKTGRTSCSKPNWQQLPSKEPPESSVRKCVIASEGHKLLTCDLPNIELRILAELAGEERMLYAFANGIDLHSATARMMFNLAETVDPDKMELRPGLAYRDVAKTINFGLAYGMTSKRLAAALKVTGERAEALFSSYKELYPTAWSYLERSARRGVEYGCVATPFGRKLFFSVPPLPEEEDYSDWRSWDKACWVHKNVRLPRIERRAKNAPIQGCNADIIKYAMCLLYQRLPAGCALIACIHDEVVVEAPDALVEESVEVVSNCMTEACREILRVVYIPTIGVEVASYWKKK